MSDRDQVYSAAAPGWRGSCELLANPAATEQDVAHRAKTELGRNLRTRGGLPGLHAAADVIRLAVDGTASYEDACNFLRDITRSHDNHPYAKVVERAADIIIIAARSRHVTLDNITVDLARYACETMLDSFVFDGMALQAVGSRFRGTSEYARFVDQCKILLAPILDELAGQLAREPSGIYIKVPAIRGLTRRSTAELLDVPLDV